MKTARIVAVLSILIMLVSALPSTKAPVSDIRGPRFDYLDFRIYGSAIGEFLAFDAGDIQLVDRWLDLEFVTKYSSTPWNSSIVLDPQETLPPSGSNQGVYVKKGLPDLGQHSSGWCWIASLANSLYWYSKRGYPGLVPEAWTQIDPDSTDPTKNGVTGPNWYDWFGDGYMTLFKEIAKRTPDATDNDDDGSTNEDPIDGIDNDADGRIDEDPGHKVFCQTVTNEEYEAMLNTYLANMGYSSSLEWRAINAPSFQDYTDQLRRGQDVILVIEGDDVSHAVTGVSFDDSQSPAVIGVSDPWTPGAADHNNNLTLLNGRYDSLTVLGTNPLALNYSGRERAVLRMYHISPISTPASPASPHKAHWSYLVNVVNDVQRGSDGWWTFYGSHFNTSYHGGTIRCGLFPTVESLNPLYATGSSDWLVLDKIYDTLLKENPYTGALQPWMARTLIPGVWNGPYGNETWLVFTLNLRADIKWHDGVPLTSDDVKFTYEYIKNYTDCWWYPEVEYIDHVVAPDPLTVTVYMRGLRFDPAIQVPILPKHIWSAISNPYGFAPDPDLVGSGPWIGDARPPGEGGNPGPEGYHLDDSVILRANRNYFRYNHPKPDVNWDGIVDIYDIITVCVSFGSTRGEELWNPRADLIADWYLIDIYDLILVAVNMGLEWGP